jgi:hypothetical protein
MKFLIAVLRVLKSHGLFFLCACSAAAQGTSSAFYTVFPTAPRPPDIPMNRDAGLGNWIIVNVHLAGGQNFPAVVDTGCPTTCLDSSFEPKLGRRITTNTLWDFGIKSQINLFLAPKLFLRDTPLMKIGPYVVTRDCEKISSAVGRPVMGILGMDILQNYCIQLDFAARQIRFLDYERANKSGWGAPMALSEVGDGCVAINGNLAGVGGAGSLIDTGYNEDGWLVPNLFELWTNQAAPPAKGEVHSPHGTLAGRIYPDVNLRGVDPKLLSTGDAHIKLNGIGLRFLARHLVTLDFPEQTLYLKPVSDRPRDDRKREREKKAEGNSAGKFLKDLERRGQLPGWAKGDSVAAGRVMIQYIDSDTVIFDVPKEGDPAIYHYTLSREWDNGRWQLIRAWASATNGEMIKEYPVPPAIDR